MKKFFTIAAAALLTFGLSACNDTASPTEGSKAEGNSQLTLKEVFEKSIEQSGSVESLKAKIDMTQVVEIPSQELSMDMKSKMDMSMTVEPLAIYQKGETLIVGEENGTQQMESYMTEDGFYIYEGMSGQWTKLPPEMSEQMMSLSGQQADPSQQLKDLEQFQDDFKFEHTEKAYILRLSASGDKFNEFIKNEMEETMPDLLAGNPGMLENMDIQKVDYEIYIDKETFNPTRLNMVLEMNIIAEGEELIIKQDLKSSFSDYNKVDEIKVPQAVIDSANAL
ncbi:DUF6612 family protein [Chungangia koreensis]|uniref:DUF6612 family protein n=1 Tax=Chungangia koreensis TaxID=752657 RepID=A0ABV8X5A4_9LACT